MSTLIHTATPGNITFPAADLEHHMKFIGTSPDKEVPSPVSMVKRGILPVSYLDKFGSDSAYRREIDAYKAEISVQP